MLSVAQIQDWYRGRTVVITGGYGYLGTGLSTPLKAMGANLRRTTRGRAGLSDPDIWTGDLLHPSFCARLVDGADVIFHMAGQTSIKTSFDDPIGDLRANVESTLNLLTACQRAASKPAFIYAGTATEIGLTETVPVPSTAPDAPISVYCANKLAAEHLVAVYAAMKAVHGTTLRIANVYGPGAMKSAADRGVTNKMIARAMKGQNLSYYGDGRLQRDYVYVTDLLDAFVRSAVVVPSATHRSYVVSGGKGYSLAEAFNLIADTVAELGYPRVDVSSAPWPADIHPIDRRSFVTNTAPLTQFCGWRPTISFRDGIRLTAESFRRGDGE